MLFLMKTERFYLLCGIKFLLFSAKKDKVIRMMELNFIQ